MAFFVFAEVSKGCSSFFLYCIKQIDSMLPCVCSVNRSQRPSKCGENFVYISRTTLKYKHNGIKDVSKTNKPHSHEMEGTDLCTIFNIRILWGFFHKIQTLGRCNSENLGNKSSCFVFLNCPRALQNHISSIGPLPQHFALLICCIPSKDRSVARVPASLAHRPWNFFPSVKGWWAAKQPNAPAAKPCWY